MKKVFLLVLFVSVALYSTNAQPTVDGDLSDGDYISLATKANGNSGFGPNIDVTEIVYYPDVTNSKLYIGVKGKFDTGVDNGIGVFLNFSGQTGVTAGTELGFSGAGHYIDGQGGGTNDNFKADFEVDYMFALNANGGGGAFFDAAKVVGGNSTDYFGTAPNLTGGTITDTDVFGTGSSMTYAVNNGGGANQGIEMVFDFAALGISSANTIEAFAFVVSATGFFSDVTVPGNVSIGSPGFNADFSTLGGGNYHSTAANLPVELTAFTATPTTNAINLNWTTASEIDNDYFVVEKSINGRDFRAIGQVEGMGSTTQTTEYNFSDNDPIQGVSYYRLKQVDFDSDVEYSQVLPVRYNRTIAVSLFPNPTSDVLNINFESRANGQGTFQLLNANGRVVKEWTQAIVAGDNIIRTDVSRLPSGVYAIRAMNSRSQAILIQERFTKR